jgi:hypothetical protein
LKAALLLSPALFAQQSFQYQASHGHSRPPHIRKAGNFGTLIIDAAGVSFQETYKGIVPPYGHVRTESPPQPPHMLSRTRATAAAVNSKAVKLRRLAAVSGQGIIPER